MNIPVLYYVAFIIFVSIISALFTYHLAKGKTDKLLLVTLFSFFMGLLFVPASWLYSFSFSKT
jgi:hypothetical protein